MKRLRSTLILLLVALGGGAFLFFYERGPAPRVGALVLLRATKNEVKSVEFLPSNLKLRREANAWRIADEKRKLDAPADPDLIENLLDAVQLVQSNAPVSKPEKLSDYGLDKPQAQLEIDGTILDFGASPRFDKRRVYARTAAGIALVESALLRWPQMNFEAWRDHAIERFEPQNINRIALRTPQLNAVFTKNEANWNIEKPLRARADADAIIGFLSAIQGARVTRWLDESGANSQKWGLAKPRATVSLRGSNFAFQLEVGAPVLGGYAARTSVSPAIFLLPDSLYSLLNRPLKTWRDPRVVSLDANLVNQIEILARGVQRKLLKDDEKWRLEGDKNTSEIRGAALDFTEFLVTLRAEDFVEAKPNEVTKNEANFGFDAPVLQIKVKSASDETVAWLRFGRAKGKIYAQNLTDSSSSKTRSPIFILNDDALASIQGALDKILPQSKVLKPI